MTEFTDVYKFKIWFIDAIEKLKELPHGNGGIAALMISIPLYERYLNVNGIDRDARRAFIKNEFGFNCIEDAQLFWNCIRDGFLHAGAPFEKSERFDPLPFVSLHGDYEAIPRIIENNGRKIIQINPWRFSAYILSKYEGAPGVALLIMKKLHFCACIKDKVSPRNERSHYYTC